MSYRSLLNGLDRNHLGHRHVKIQLLQHTTCPTLILTRHAGKQATKFIYRSPRAVTNGTTVCERDTPQHY